MKQLKTIFLIILMIVLIPLYSWSQDSIRCYDREERNIIALHNIERMECFEILVSKDSTIVILDSIIELKDSTMYYQEMASDLLSNKYIESINVIQDKDKTINKLRRRKIIAKSIVVVETLIIIAICLL